jgi:hypothetical protein
MGIETDMMSWSLLINLFFTAMSRRYFPFITLAIVLVFTVISATTVTAQVIRTGDIAQKIYVELPEVPLENQYFNRKINKVDPNNTLISRVIRYHSYVKGRPVALRLDWKLTIADYLGANDTMDLASYPGQDILAVNPMDSDRAAVNTLSRQTRDRLIERLIKYIQN